MNEHQRTIIEYVEKVTKGVVRLKPEHADNIIDLCYSVNHLPYVVVNRYSHIKERYEKIRKEKLSRELNLNNIILEHTQKKPIEKFYRYDIFDGDNNFITYIYSINSNLF